SSPSGCSCAGYETPGDIFTRNVPACGTAPARSERYSTPRMRLGSHGAPSPRTTIFALTRHLPRSPRPALDSSLPAGGVARSARRAALLTKAAAREMMTGLNGDPAMERVPSESELIYDWNRMDGFAFRHSDRLELND